MLIQKLEKNLKHEDSNRIKIKYCINCYVLHWKQRNNVVHSPEIEEKGIEEWHKNEKKYAIEHDCLEIR